MPTIEELERGLQPPEEPQFGGPDLAAIRREGRHHRRRRQLVSSGVAAVVTAGVATAAVALPQALNHRDGQTEAAGAATAPSSQSSDLLESCRNGENSPHAVGLMFGPGTPTVEAVSRSSHGISLAIESADGRYWADCHIARQQAEFPAAMNVYRASSRTTDFASSYGSACGPADESCGSFSASFVDRRPDRVAAAKVVTGDGRTTVVHSHDGFLVFEYLGTLPDSVDPSDVTTGDFAAIRRITFLDATGHRVAAQAMDGSGAGPDGEKIGDLPTLTAFPSLRGDPIL